MYDTIYHSQCPRCGLYWTADEIKHQHCDDCNWPREFEPISDDDDNEFFDDDDDDDEI